MEFCPECGAMLMPKKGMVKCRCGYKKDLSKDDIEEQYTMEGEKNPQAKVIVTDNKNVALPTTKITCYKCGGTKGYWWTVQTRSAEEHLAQFKLICKLFFSNVLIGIMFFKYYFF